jgi:hypothetical protein
VAFRGGFVLKADAFVSLGGRVPQRVSPEQPGLIDSASQIAHIHSVLAHPGDLSRLHPGYQPAKPLGGSHRLSLWDPFSVLRHGCGIRDYFNRRSSAMNPLLVRRKVADPSYHRVLKAIWSERVPLLLLPVSSRR